MLPLSPSRTGHILVAGIGNDFRSDDGAGVAVAKQLEAQSVEGVRILRLTDDLTPLVHELKDISRAFIVDAARSGAAPGTIHRIPMRNHQLSTGPFSRSTHSVSLPDILELARLNGLAQSDVVLYGIEGATFDHGQSMSPEVTSAVHRVVELIGEEIRHASENKRG